MTKTTFNPEDPAFATPDGSTIFAKFGYSAAVRSGDHVFVAGADRSQSRWNGTGR
ncbi:MAG: hypothetical protein ACN6I5_04745 [Hyphomicrobiales bacterium]